MVRGREIGRADGPGRHGGQDRLRYGHIVRALRSVDRITDHNQGVRIHLETADFAFIVQRCSFAKHHLNHADALASVFTTDGIEQTAAIVLVVLKDMLIPTIVLNTVCVASLFETLAHHATRA